jgi:cytoskeletal protein RodZ
MASIPPQRAHEPLTGPQHFSLPSARELRAQAVQRLQAGLFGIAAVLLVVGLANIINDRARMTEQAGKPAAAQASASASPTTSDPLADIGVVPSAETATASPAASGRPNVQR